MVAPTCFGITLPSLGSVSSAFWQMVNWGAVGRILLMGVLCLVSSDVVRGDLRYCVNSLSLSLSLSLVRTYESKGFRRFSVGMEIKEGESSNGRVWAAGIHHVTAHSRLASVLKLMYRLFFKSPVVFGLSKIWQWKSGFHKRRNFSLLDILSAFAERKGT
jgi:hypothetical protein